MDTSSKRNGYMCRSSIACPKKPRRLLSLWLDLREYVPFTVPTKPSLTG